MNLTPAQEQYIVTLAPGEAAVFADGADYPWLVRMPDGTGREAAPAATAGLRAGARGRRGSSGAGRVISARVNPGPLAAHVAAAMRRALPDGCWLCEEEEPQFLAPPYRWVLVLEALQAACRDGPDGRHPRSAEWERDYGRPIPGQDGAAQLETITRWHHDDQRDTSRLHAVAWGQRPEAALASAIGAKAGEADWDERVASQLSHFTAPCRWPLDHLTRPGPGHG